VASLGTPKNKNKKREIKQRQERREKKLTSVQEKNAGSQPTLKIGLKNLGS
jgi:hypothetical protein